MMVKQNILNMKQGDGAWKCFTTLDLEEEINESWLVKHFPIGPPAMRPACQTTGAKKSISHNDLTHRLGSLIRIDKSIRKRYSLGVQIKKTPTRLEPWEIWDIQLPY